MRRYEFKKEKQFYILYECGIELTRFKHDDFRSALAKLDRGSNWVGSMLKLFKKRYPRKHYYRRRDSATDYDLDTLLCYLREKGYRCYKPLDVSDTEIIALLNARGWAVERGDLNHECFLSAQISDN